MPDTFTHIALPSLFHKKLGTKILVPVFLIGTILPDYFREFFGLVLPIHYYSAIYVFHTIPGALLLSLAVAALFVKNQRRQVFVSVFLGSLLHFGFDILQGYACPGRFYLLFPLHYSFELGLIPESAWPYIFIFSSICFISFLLIRYFHEKNQT